MPDSFEVRQVHYFFLLGRCVRADAATDFTAFEVDGLRNSFDAVVATRLEVVSFLLFAIKNLIVLAL
jgi:hypothetical protein